MMDKKQIEEKLIGLFWDQQMLESFVEGGEADEQSLFFQGITDVRPFDGNLCTMDNGVIVDLADGTQIVLTIQTR